MEKPELPEMKGLKEDAFYIGLSILLVTVIVGAHNLATPEDPKDVGYVTIDARCVGIDAGMCLGIQRQTHDTINYDNYTEPEPGTENFYRRVEAELMMKAYNTCTEEMSGMEWVSKVEYRNRTAAEWLQNKNVQLLPCEKTFFRNMTG
ncbi:MAG: hypothetical protein ABEJ98_02325 [Candidatus Nanohaloarchaea archaeon]